MAGFRRDQICFRDGGINGRPVTAAYLCAATRSGKNNRLDGETKNKQNADDEKNALPLDATARRHFDDATGFFVCPVRVCSNGQRIAEYYRLRGDRYGVFAVTPSGNHCLADYNRRRLADGLFTQCCRAQGLD